MKYYHPQRKKVHQQPKLVQTEYIEAPESLKERIGNLTVADDVMFVNGIPFVVSVSKGVNLKMVEYVSRRLKNVFDNSIGNIFHFYKNNGYNIKITDG